MTYSVRLTASAQRDLGRIPERYRTAILEFIYGPLADNPQRVGKELEDKLAGFYSARRGDYRVIYRIHEADVEVEVVRMGHRSGIYR